MSPAEPAPRLTRRSTLGLWAATLAALSTALAQPLARPAAAQTRSARISVKTESGELRARFDPRGGFAVTSLVGHGTVWVADEPPHGGGVWIEGVQVEGGGDPLTIDGAEDLELVSSSTRSLTLAHRPTGLRIALEYEPAPGDAIAHRLTLTNGRSSGKIWVGWAATLGLRLAAGDWLEALAADDAPGAWNVARLSPPATLGNHELRNAVGGHYPLVRLGTEDGSGIIIAVNTATAWRVELAGPPEPDDSRLLRAGEYQSDLSLDPGEQARLPEVVTLFYQDGEAGAVEALRRYLDHVSAPAPRGWEATPPVVFNTWFGYGTALRDDGSPDSELRHAARVAAEAGAEVFVVDAGWYLGNPVPNAAGERGQGGQKLSRGDAYVDDGSDDDDGEGVAVSVPDVVTAGDFEAGLGTWVENPDKWLARPGQDGSRAAGLRSFSDYVRGLTVRRPDGSGGGRMKFGLWIEPERMDRAFRDRQRVPRAWTIPGTPVLDFSRREVVEGITAKVQRMIDAYRVDYLKVDANFDLVFDAERKRTGHFWTRWSAGFERFLSNLRRENPGLYLEHCASGLKRYWLGLNRHVHGHWLDDDVNAGNVGWLLDRTDSLMLPRQKIALVTEESPAGSTDVWTLVEAYWGGERRNGGAIGFSNRLEAWEAWQRRRAAAAVERWKREVRTTLARPASGPADW